MDYIFTEKEFLKTKQLAEDTANKAEVLKYYLEANARDLSIEIMLALYKDIRKAIGDIAYKFMVKESGDEDEDF